MRSQNYSSDITSWLDNAGRYEPLSKDATLLIARKIQSLPEGHPRRRKLVNKLVCHNLKLVARFVKDFMDRSCHHKWGSPETVDYLQVGAIGLTRAAEKFDPARGYAFSTYANYWIRSKVGRYNLTTSTPVHVSESAIRQVIFFNRNGYMKTHTPGKGMKDAKVREVLYNVKAAQGYVSTDAKVLDTNLTVGDTLADRRGDCNPQALHDELHDVMDSIGVPDLGKEVLFAHYVHQEPTRVTAERLNLSQGKVVAARKEALELARRHSNLFPSV